MNSEALKFSIDKSPYVYSNWSQETTNDKKENPFMLTIKYVRTLCNQCDIFLFLSEWVCMVEVFDKNEQVLWGNYSHYDIDSIKRECP